MKMKHWKKISDARSKENYPIASFVALILCPKIFTKNRILFSEYKVGNRTNDILPTWNLFLLNVDINE